MEYINISDLDYSNTFFHFSRIDNRKSIEENGIKSVAGGENEAGCDSKNPTIYFSYKPEGLLKTIDVWIKWEYNKLVKSNILNVSLNEPIDEYLMHEIYMNVYEDFKNRNYYKLDLIEGKDPKTSDFSFNGIDKKKEEAYNIFLNKIDLYNSKKIKNKPKYPPSSMKWMYGSYSDFDNGSIKQDDWNMNTHIGDRIIPSSRFKIIETTNGRTDALSVILEMYDKFRDKLPDIDLSRLDDFIQYAKKEYEIDIDYLEGAPDIGRREINKKEAAKYKEINGIVPTDKLVSEAEDSIYFLPETESNIKKHIKLLIEKFKSQFNRDEQLTI